MNRLQTRTSLCAFAAVGLAVAAATPAKQGQAPGHRKTTDPPIAAKGKYGQDLFLAIDHRNPPEVEALIKKGADANSRNGLEFTPLHIAAASYQPEIVDALLAAGAAADAETPYGSPMLFAAASGNLPAVRTLLSKGAKLDPFRVDGITVLMMAVNSGNPDLVAELIAKKAVVNAGNYSGSTPLHYAARSGNPVVAKMLVDAGAKLDVKDETGATPLMIAAMGGNTEVAQLLLVKGANPNLQNKQKQSALILATAFRDDPATVQVLLKGGGKQRLEALKIAKTRGFAEAGRILGGSATTATLPAPKQAAMTGLKALESSMVEFSKKSSCVSCHHEGLGRIVTGVAKEKGFPVDQALKQMQAARIAGPVDGLKPLHEGALQNPELMKQIPLFEINELTPLDSWLLTGMAYQQTPANGSTSAMAQVLAKQQSPDGAWRFSMPRAPMQSSIFTFTALSVRSMQQYAPKTAEANVQVAKAKEWLMASEATTSDDLAFKLLGLKWAGATVGERKAAIAAILKAQQRDGGWSQLPGGKSDAYATGQALYALRQGGGLLATDTAYKNGVRYLLKTQQPDGTWFVAKRAFPANNYFDAGFPYGESQFASFNATCWATLALMEAK